MVRRRGGNYGSGGAQHNSNIDRTLRRHISSAGRNYSTVEQMVDHLRSTYPHYARHKLQPFAKRVEKIIQFSTRKKDNADESNDEGDTPITKRKRKVDEKEEKLQRVEARHIKRRSNDVDSSGLSSSSLASAGSSGEDDSSFEEATTSEDAIYGEKIEPEFDLMKSLMRDNLGGKSKRLGDEREAKEDVGLEVVDNKGVKEREAKENVELEVVDNKGIKDVHLLDEEGRSYNGLRKNTKSDKEVKGVMFKDLGGMSGVIEELKMEVLAPLYHPQITCRLGVKPMAGILLHGPPGCGKTKLAHAIANETGVPFYKIAATELVSGVSGASEENIREFFSKVYRTAPSIVFIDEIDAIASKREKLQRETDRRIVTQLMDCIDESRRLVKTSENNEGSEISDFRSGHVLVIGATNRPDAIDEALRRPGRLDHEIVLGVPDESARIEILKVLTRNLNVEGAFDLKKIARSTPGFVGADLTALADKAGNLAMRRVLYKRKLELSKELLDEDHSEEWWKKPWSDEEIGNLSITMADFEEAAKMVQPSSRREGFSAIPNVKWDNVGGLHLLREEFDYYIVKRIKRPEEYEDFGVGSDACFLLYGPPGCGKTLIAKAVANEAGASFIHIKGPELLNKYVGESELAVRTLFNRARTSAPCIIFFDEVDALTTKHSEEGGGVVQRLLIQLQMELDGAGPRKGVFVIGATNRPEVMDAAVLRPGRFGRRLYVPLPNPDERGMILKALSRKKPIDPDVDLMAVGRDDACEKFSGADLSALMNEAAMAALKDYQSSDRSPSIPKTIRDVHFKRALEKISPSVSDKQIQHYKLLSESFAAKRN